LDKETASYPKAKEYQKMKVAGMGLSGANPESSDTKERTGDKDSEEDSDDEDSEEEFNEELKGEYIEEEGEKELQNDEEERNWWGLPSDTD
jgi:hypothetical protein